MAKLPSASTRIASQSSGIVTGTDLIAVWAAVPTAADLTWRLYYDSQDIYDRHGYSMGLDYSGLHMTEPRLPVLLCGLPIDVPGVVGRVDTSGNTGTSVVSVAVGSAGSLDEVEGVLVVRTGGTIGTDQIVLELSLDNGRIYKTVKLGTAATYTIPYVGQVLSFAAGDLVAGDTVITWASTAPKPADADIATAKTALAAQLKQVRSWLAAWPWSESTDSSAIDTAVAAFETTDERYAVAYAGLRKREPVCKMSTGVVARMTGDPQITFTEVGATGDTITRNAGSFVTDGFLPGDYITVSGTTLNNCTAKKITNATALVLTLDTEDVDAEVVATGCEIVAYAGLTFTEVGATGDTIVRNRGSWIADGFREGDNFTIAGTTLNDKTTTAGIATVTASTITLDTDDLVNEGIDAGTCTIVGGETDAQCIAALDEEFKGVTAKRRLSIGYGHGAMLSPVLGYRMRRPSIWADSLLQYKVDLGKTTWCKDDEPIASRLACGFDLNDVDGQPYEHDERTTGGALDAGFTCARTWGNGPEGAFIARSLTRAGDGTPLLHTHQMLVTSLAQTVCQQTTERFAGKTLVLLPPDALGRRMATADSLKLFESKVNAELGRHLLGNMGGSGPRASNAYWKAATDDDLGGDDATLNGTLTLLLNGVLVHINTSLTVS